MGYSRVGEPAVLPDSSSRNEPVGGGAEGNFFPQRRRVRAEVKPASSHDDRIGNARRSGTQRLPSKPAPCGGSPSTGHMSGTGSTKGTGGQGRSEADGRGNRRHAQSRDARLPTSRACAHQTSPRQNGRPSASTTRGHYPPSTKCRDLERAGLCSGGLPMSKDQALKPNTLCMRPRNGVLPNARPVRWLAASVRRCAVRRECPRAAVGIVATDM